VYSPQKSQLFKHNRAGVAKVSEKPPKAGHKKEKDAFCIFLFFVIVEKFKDG
jgi:hypothetical protein